MKFVTPILSALILLGVGYLVYEQVTARTIVPVVPAYLQQGDEHFAADLLGRSVTLPAGQLWGFNTDQKLTAKVVSLKALDDNNVLVIANVTAHANIVNPSDKESKKPPPPGTPKVLTLEGLVKMYYEKINNQWYLTQVEGVSLRVAADEL